LLLRFILILSSIDRSSCKISSISISSIIAAETCTVTVDYIPVLTGGPYAFDLEVDYDLSEVNLALNQAREDIAAMNEAGFPVNLVEGLLEDALWAVNDTEYKKALDLVQEIHLNRKNSFEAFSIMEEVQVGIQAALDRWLTVPESENGLALARVAFEREDFALALQRAKDAQLNLILEEVLLLPLF